MLLKNQQLKAKRTVEKRAFTRLVNTISKACKGILEEDLWDSLSKFKMQAKKVMEANDNFEAGIIAELEAELGTEGQAVVPEQKKADLEESECEKKLQEIKSLLYEALWSKFEGNALQALRKLDYHVTMSS